jgi:hypothetical protein
MPKTNPRRPPTQPAAPPTAELSRRNLIAVSVSCEDPPGQTVFDCERISKTALDLGVITSLEIIRSNDLTR